MFAANSSYFDVHFAALQRTLTPLEDSPMNSTHPCDAAAELQASWVYAVITGVKFLACTVGAILTTIMWKRRGVSWLIHSNSKTLFTFYYALVVSMGVIYGGIYGFEFTRLRFPCFSFDFRIILSVRVAGTVTIAAAHLIMVCISLERLYSSLRPLHFEQVTQRRLAIIVSSTITVLTLFLITWADSNQFRLFFEHNLVSSIDMKISANAEGYQLTYIGMSCTFIPTSLIFALDWYLNFVRNARVKTAPLSISYQYSENRMVISTLGPLEAATATITIVATVAQMTYHLVSPNLSPVGRAIFLEGTSFSPLWPLFFAILLEKLLQRKERKRAATVADLRSAENNATAEYFASLAASWK